MEYSDFDYEYGQMPGNMMGYGYETMQCPYMRYLYGMNRHQCPFSADFDFRDTYDYSTPFLMPRIVSVDIDELF